MEFKVTVNQNQDSKRAVDVLIDEFEISAQMQKRIRLYGNLWINGKPGRMIDIVHTGDRIVAHSSQNYSELLPVKTNRIPGVEVLFEDEHLIVLNKPSDMVVHPTMSHSDNTLLDLLSEKILHPVTRLDRETSGALIIAKHAHAHYRLVQNPIKRVYWALTHGHWTKEQGVIEQPIMRFPNSIMIRVIDLAGKAAITNYKVLYSFQEHNFDWVEFILETGRTHQIRVHSLYHGHPLLGDGLYGITNYCELDHQANFNILEIDPNLHFLYLHENSIHENFIDHNKQQNYLIDINLLKISPQRIAPEYQSKFKSLINKKQLLLDQMIKRQALHSRLIGFTHPITKKHMEFKAQLPSDMMTFLEDMR
ncbi:MAG TPA: RluA family pseudouridine synthase [Clostridiaceae bacterium]|nr:RluA family pseudouridine synthase [Clostridiaceae bacterium]